MEDREFLILTLLLNYLIIPSSTQDGHGYYYKDSGEKCKRQACFTEGIGLHDGTCRQIELR